jgi:SAM-dependent methyltransferase
MPTEKHQVGPEHYGSAYDSKKRFITYWHQINEILECMPTRVLEIGIGNGFVSKYLKDRGQLVTTCDFDERLHPDYVASITDLPFKNDEFDVVSACEILEHIPYEKFLSAIKELRRVISKCAIISLPDATPSYRIEFPIPKMGKFRRIFELPKLSRPLHDCADPEHFWEIGKQNYELSRICDDFTRAGFEITKTYRVFESPYHRFFILKKIEQ